MALVVIKTWCEKCGSLLIAGKPHKCYPERNYNNESINIRQTHLVHAKKAGDLCSCGNQDCRYCGGTGRIS